MLKKLSYRLLGILLCMCLLLGSVTPAMAAVLMITQQPESVLVNKGEKVTVSVSVKGDGLKYEWWYANAGTIIFNRSTLNLQKPNEYTVEMNESRDGRRVYCIVTDAYGHTVQTKTVTIGMITPFEIISQPQDAKAADGESVSTMVEATGSGLTYTWWYKNVNEPQFLQSSITGPVYEQVMNELRGGRQVYCVITDRYGNTLQSEIATLIRRLPLEITEQPQNTMAAKNTDVQVKIGVRGDGIKYEWWMASNETAPFIKTDVVGDTFVASMNEAIDGSLVFCVVTDEYGNVLQSDTVTVTMMPELVVTRQPQNAYARSGEKISVSVEASGEELTYAWWFANADSDEYARSSTTVPVYEQEMNEMRHGRKLYCVITDKYGQSVQTDTVTLSMRMPLEIVRQPAHMSAEEGEEVVIAPEIAGDGLKYAWFISDNAGDFVEIGCTDAQYAYEMQAESDGRKVYCVAMDAYGDSVQTDTVLITMIPKGLQYEISADQAVVTGYTGDASVLVIPAVIEGCPVTGIGDKAFAGCTTLESITLPQGIKVIGDEAFSRCVGLRSIVVMGDENNDGIHGSVTAPGAMENIVSVKLPDSITAIGTGAFSGCDSLVSVNLPASLEMMGSAVFADCDKLAYVTVDAQMVNLAESWLGGLDKSKVQICCYEFSYAESWATERGYAVRLMDGGSIIHVEMPARAEVVRGEQKSIPYTVYCVSGTLAADEIFWASSAEEIARVDESGCVTGVESGVSVITLHAGSGMAACEMRVGVEVENFELAADEVYVVAKESVQLAVDTVVPADADAFFAWTSEDAIRASVDENGLVDAKVIGDVSITARSINGLEKTCVVHICYPVTEIQFEQSAVTAEKGTSVQLTAHVTARDAVLINKLVAFSSSDETIATVDENGVVMLQGLGIVTITASAGSGVAAQCVIESVCINHETVTDAAVAATCTEEGLTEGKHCSVCGEVLAAQETVPAAGHTEETDAAVAATCTEEGLTEGKHCSVCGEVLTAQEAVPAAGHVEETDAAVAATCTEEGLTEGKHCSVCGEVLTAQEVVPAAGHIEETDEAVAPENGNDGLTEGKHCSVCGEVLVKQEVIISGGSANSGSDELIEDK